jgi:hypothetical protein
VDGVKVSVNTTDHYILGKDTVKRKKRILEIHILLVETPVKNSVGGK